MTVPPRKTCRVCGNSNLDLVVDIGKQYVSDFVDSPSTEGNLCSIQLMRCSYCTLVQQRYTAPQDFLYTRHYWYRSGITETMRNALADVARAAEKYLVGGDWVLDIGSNDGTLLRSYKKKNIVRIGVEPATNLAEPGRLGVDLLVEDFWSVEALYEALSKWGNLPTNPPIGFKAITACGMFYDLEDPNTFIADVAKALLPDGVFICQLMCLKQTLALRDVGNLSHEHLEFYTLRSLENLFARHGLVMFNIEENKVNGGSYRIFVRHLKGHVEDTKQQRIRLGKFFDSEAPFGDSSKKIYNEFVQDLEKARDECVNFVRNEVERGAKVWTYGASTKGNVILQYLGLNSAHIGGASDRDSSKVGKYTIGTSIKIHSEDEARKVNPDYFLVLPYSFLPEFLDREIAWRNKGGKFIVPIPSFHIV